MKNESLGGSPYIYRDIPPDSYNFTGETNICVFVQYVTVILKGVCRGKGFYLP